MLVCVLYTQGARSAPATSFLCFLTENLSSDSALSSPSALNSPGQGIEGLNRRRKKRTSIETNIRVALEKSFLEVSGGSPSRVHGLVGVALALVLLATARPRRACTAGGKETAPIERACPGAPERAGSHPQSTLRDGRQLPGALKNSWTGGVKSRVVQSGCVLAPVPTIALRGQSPKGLGRQAVAQVNSADIWLFLVPGSTIKASNTLLTLILRGLSAGEGALSQESVVSAT